MTPEGRIKAQVNKLLARPGVYRFMPVQGGYGVQTLDYLVCVGGTFIGIETKAPGKKPTGRQENTIRQIRDAGGTVFVIDGDEGLTALKHYLDLKLWNHSQND